MNPSWMTLVSTETVLVFKDEDNFPTFHVSSDVPSLEEPVMDHTSWKELKNATLSEDFDNVDNEDNEDIEENEVNEEEDVMLTSNGEVNAPSTATRFNYDDILLPIIKHMKIYGCKPLKDESGIVNCKECSKKVLPYGFIDHSVNCEKIKAEEFEAQNADASTDVSANDVTVEKFVKTPITETYNSSHSSKKPEATEQLPNAKRPNSPCGVVVPPNTPCARSLTCKSHSMALKRSVLGRSQSYDLLLAAYQKKSIGRPQNNGIQSNKQDSVKKDGKLLAPEKEEEEMVDSEEEVDAVMSAIMYSNPQPLVTRPESFVPQRSNYFIYSNDILPKGIA
ncbi:13926_t:CDS:2 [Funneliformis geosporum]|uniref:13926_t:CDS:1 n=1 Tax=Funneliformis geosporum TaxID=1117311 RepID=A0A9W4SIV0_9GLOM|nr:13926_t:CDS:2 [Funneliformis geosporum]